MVFANFCFGDFPNFTGLAADLDIWYNFWDEIKYKNEVSDSILSILKRADASAFHKYAFDFKTPWNFAYYN